MPLRWSKRGTLFFGQAAFVAATALCLIVKDYWLFLGSRFVMGLSYAFF